MAQLEALREVGEAVGSSLDLDEVLEQVVGNAVRLTNRGFGDITLRTDGGSILEYDDSSDSFHVHAAGSSPALLERLRATTIHRDSTLVGRAALERRPLEVPDLGRCERDPHLDILFRDGWRSVLAVPMLRGEKIVGVLVIRRRGTGSFPPDVIDAARDLRQPVGAGHRQRAPVPRTARPRPPNSRSQAVTSRSSWPACPTNCGRR